MLTNQDPGKDFVDLNLKRLYAVRDERGRMVKKLVVWLDTIEDYTLIYILVENVKTLKRQTISVWKCGKRLNGYKYNHVDHKILAWKCHKDSDEFKEDGIVMTKKEKLQKERKLRAMKNGLPI